MFEIPTLYTSYEELMLDLSIYGKVLCESNISYEDLKDLLFEEYKMNHPLPTLEDERYKLSSLVSSNYHIQYTNSVSLSDNEELVDLRSEGIDNSIEREMIVVPEELRSKFTYSCGITESLRDQIIREYMENEEIEMFDDEKEVEFDSVGEGGIYEETDNYWDSDDVSYVDEEDDTEGCDDNYDTDEEDTDGFEDDPYGDNSDEGYDYDDDEDDEVWGSDSCEDDESVDDDDSSESEGETEVGEMEERVYTYSTESYDDEDEDDERYDPYSDDEEDEDYDPYASDEDEEYDPYSDDEEEGEEYDPYSDDEEEEENEEYDPYSGNEEEEDEDEYEEYSSYSDNDGDEDTLNEGIDEDSEEEYVSYTVGEDDESESGYESYDDEDDEDDESGNDYESYDEGGNEESEDYVEVEGFDSYDEDSEDEDEYTVEERLEDVQGFSSHGEEFIVDEVSNDTVEIVEHGTGSKEEYTSSSGSKGYDSDSVESKPISYTPDIKVNRAEEPSDLRQFVRLHPRCEISFALQYFSQKEIQKYLRLGKIFKKGNKLHI